ncbi:unnamed protein product, partial [Effrenium voratum]
NTICTNSKFPPSPLPKKNRKNNTHKITLLRLAQDCPCFRCRAAFKLPTLPPLRLPMPHASRDVSPQASPRRSPACSPAPEVPRPNPPPPPAPPPAPSPVSRSVPASARRMYNW